MSRTAHTRRHAHRWIIDKRTIHYLGTRRIVTQWYRCERVGCFAGKVVTR